MSESFIEINQSVVYTRIINPEGKKKILIIHGWNQLGGQSWVDFIKKLSKNKELCIILIDLPAFGKSPSPASVWGIEEYTNLIGGILRKIDDSKEIQARESRWILMGHSFGGAIASYFTKLYPNRVEKLILVAPAIIRKPKNLKLTLIEKITHKFKKILSKDYLDPYYDQVKKIWYKLIKSNDYYQSSGIKKLIMQKIIKQDILDFISDLDVKTILIWGKKDTQTPFNQAKLIKERIVNCQLAVLEDAKHGIHLQKSEKLIDLVLNFIFQK